MATISLSTHRFGSTNVSDERNHPPKRGRELVRTRQMNNPRPIGPIILVGFIFGHSGAFDLYGQSPAALLERSIRREEAIMSLLVWIVLGLAAGLIGSRLVKTGRERIMADILLGVVGAMVGGSLFYAFGPGGVNGLNLASHFVAVAGSLIVLLLYYALRRN